MPSQYWIILFSGSLIVITFNSLGAIASRKLNFNYSKLSIWSMLIFIIISIWATRTIGAMSGITICGLIGLVDALLGWKICKYFDANLGPEADFIKKEMEEGRGTRPSFVIGLVLFGIFIGWVGTLFA